jgi:hypothetical protein
LKMQIRKVPERSSRLVQICDINRTRFKRVKQDAASNDHGSMQLNSGADLIASKVQNAIEKRGHHKSRRVKPLGPRHPQFTSENFVIEQNCESEILDGRRRSETGAAAHRQ